uniref:Uncharacterized protein n=1 Tax=Mycena chlorophos TaxID=658473 RepID=A0ABQ0KVZ3_MYCCL|nr:predicted protein [Mycena chlorophos]
MADLFVLPSGEVTLPGRPDIVNAGTEIRFFRDGAGLASAVITGRYAILEQPSEEVDIPEFFDTIGFLDDVYHDSRPALSVVRSTAFVWVREAAATQFVEKDAVISCTVELQRRDEPVVYDGPEVVLWKVVRVLLSLRVMRRQLIDPVVALTRAPNVSLATASPACGNGAETSAASASTHYRRPGAGSSHDAKDPDNRPGAAYSVWKRRKLP